MSQGPIKIPIATFDTFAELELHVLKRIRNEKDPSTPFLLQEVDDWQPEGRAVSHIVAGREILRCTAQKRDPGGESRYLLERTVDPRDYLVSRLLSHIASYGELARMRNNPGRPSPSQLHLEEELDMTLRRLRLNYDELPEWAQYRNPGGV